MRPLPKLIFATATALVLLVATVHSQQTKSENIQIVWTVLGRWKSGGMLAMPGGTVPEFILVRVDEPGGNIQSGQYIFVQHSYSSKEEEKLPKNFYKRMSEWQFTLITQK